MPFPGSPVAAVSKAASGSLCYPRPVLVFLIALYVRWMFRSTLGPVQRVTAVTAIPPATPGFAERPDFGARDLWKAVLHEAVARLVTRSAHGGFPDLNAIYSAT